MDTHPRSTDMDETRGDGRDESQSNVPETPDDSTTDQSRSLGEASSLEQISTEDTDLFSHNISLRAYNTTGRVSLCGPCSVEKHQPHPLHALLPSSTEACPVYEVSQSFTSVGRSHTLLKSSETSDADDLCASILLACLFCHPLDCLLGMMRGCGECVWWLCSSVCGCEPSTLQPLVDFTRRCEVCRCLGVRCVMCDCPVCDLCLQATECLDLAMEISQMLYH